MNVVRITQYGPLSINLENMTQTVRYRMKHDLFKAIQPKLSSYKVELVSTNYITFVAVLPISSVEDIRAISASFTTLRRNKKCTK